MAHPASEKLAVDSRERAAGLPTPVPDGNHPTAHPVTRQAHDDAVLRIIALMREGYARELTLEDMAEAALFSPFYSNRLFRSLTGVQPRRFLAAIRFDAAKRLLLDSALSVTEICYEVGYTSLGSFTTRFHQGVGVSPRQFRRYPDSTAGRPLPCAPFGNGSSLSGRALIRGSSRAEAGYKGVTFVGLFPTPLPQGVPLSCTLTRTPGTFSLPCGRAGRAFLLAVALPQPASQGDCLLPTASELRVASQPVAVRDTGHPRADVDLRMRPLRPTDPPIVTALPYLLERTFEGRTLRKVNGVPAHPRPIGRQAGRRGTPSVVASVGSR